MNILFVIPNLEIGGAQSFLLRLVSAMHPKHNVILLNVHPHQVNEKFSGQLLSPDVKVIHSCAEWLELKINKCLPKPFASIVKKILFKIIRPNKINQHQLKRILKKNKIELINSHMYLADLYVYNHLNNQQNKVKWIPSFHGCYNLLLDKYADSPLLKKISKDLKNILEKTNGVITAAEKHYQVQTSLQLQDIPFKKVYYGFTPHSFNKIDLREKYSIPKDNIIFGMVARGDKTKGWQEAINAYLSLSAEDKERSYLVLTGDGDYLLELEKDYQQESHIIFTGPSDKPLREINNFDVGLLPTYYPAESLPNTVIEYLYCGKPVIASDWAEIPFMIDSQIEKAGIIIGITNNKADLLELSNAMSFYIQNKYKKIEEHGKLALQAFEKFKMDKCINGYISFFNNPQC